MEESMKLFLRVEAPIILVALYLLSKTPVASFRDFIGIQADSGGLKAFVFLHNVALAVFSAWVMINTWPMLYNYLMVPYKTEEVFWDSQIGYWAIIFYISKYYEFIDSWILVLKSKVPSFLQVYHHAGVVYAMYFACTSKANWIIYMVCLNSFIHTLMYTYYAVATVQRKNFFTPYASILTTMQITQFIIGIVASAPSYFDINCSEPVKTSLFFMHAYAIGLIKLFHDMAREKYKKK